MSERAERIAQINALTEELTLWTDGKSRSWTNLVARDGTPEGNARADAAVAILDGAHVMALSAQINAAIALLQVEADR